MNFTPVKDISIKFLKRLYYLKVNRDNKRIINNYHEFLSHRDNKSRDEHPKSALLSYLVTPLLPKPEKRDTSTFSNAGIAQYIPRALNELGYSVDIVNYDNKSFFPEKKYDLFIGHAGINFKSIAQKLHPDCVKIYFSTGTYWKSWNQMEKDRLEDLKRRKGIQLPVDRIIENDEEYANSVSEGIICLGNEVAKNTYEKFPLVINLNNAVFPDSYSSKGKNFNKSRNNFLFFNGAGNVHKGLDLLLDAFSHLDQHLYVRQEIEPAFFNIYKKELTENSNIHVIKYLKKPSREFFSLMDTCNFIISPTCAEGQPGSVIECMAHGLIPILSKEANIDTRDFGITLNNNSIEEIISVVKNVSQKSDEWYKNKSLMTVEEIQNYYTPEQFLNNMKKAIQIIMQVTRT